MAGVPVVLAVAAGLVISLGSLEETLRVLAPMSTFALPVIAMIAFWWEDWPGTRFRPAWSLLVDIAVVITGAVLLTVLGQIVTGHVDLRSVFGSSRHTYSPTFPAVMPLAACVFVVMLQLTLVSEGWPLRRLGRLTAGTVALTFSCGAALLVYLLVIDTHPPLTSGLRARDGSVSGPDLGALLVAIGAWQVVFFVALRGWPFAAIAVRGRRLLTANAVVLTAGLVTYLLATRAFGISADVVPAAGGCLIVAGLAQGLLFEGWPETAQSSLRGRVNAMVACIVSAAVLYVALSAVADSVVWRAPASSAGWVAYTTLNALGIGIILHVAIGRRWPLGTGELGGVANERVDVSS